MQMQFNTDTLTNDELLELTAGIIAKSNTRDAAILRAVLMRCGTFDGDDDVLYCVIESKLTPLAGATILGLLPDEATKAIETIKAREGI